MKTIHINIKKNFGKSVTLELPTGEKHLITYSAHPYLYQDIMDIINKEPEPKDTFILPDDFDFGDEKIPFENIED